MFNKPIIKIKFFIVVIILTGFTSCQSVKKGFKDPEVFLYDGQASYMNGTYFVDPYSHNGPYKLLTEIFDLKNAEKVKKVDFNFVDDKHLKITYTDGIKTFTKTVKGKLKNGAFRYVNKTLPIGIPIILFSFNRVIHQIALGNDDNIIISEYHYSNNHFILTGISENKKENIYYFDRQLK